LSIVVSASLLSTVNLMAMAVVDTLTGGPFQGNPRYYGYVDGNTATTAQFHTPIGLALNRAGTFLFVADRDNNAIRQLDLAGNQTFTFATTGLDRPVGVAVDGAGTVYALNANGDVVVFDAFGDYQTTWSSGVANAVGIALDGSTNVFVSGGSAIVRITPSGDASTITTVEGGSLQGIAVLNNGSLAVADAGGNGIRIVNPTDGTFTNLTGFNGVGDHFGSRNTAQFNQPYGIAAAGGGVLVVADFGNHRVKVVDPAGTVTNLYGVAPAFWVTGPGTFPGWWDGNVCRGDANYNSFGCVEGRLPAGVTVAPDGSIYTTEDYYHLIRHVTATGLTSPTGGGGSGTNIVVLAPTISPSSGYFPMGQLIMVSSPNPDVHFTMDGTEPTTNSPSVAMSGNVGFIKWFNSTNDLTALRVKAFIGNVGSATVSGQPVSTNSIGTPPGPTADKTIWAGIGSTIVIPVVANLRTNDAVRSYQFRVEITPNGAAPRIPPGFEALDISTNDFVRLTTAAQSGNTTGRISVVSYDIGTTAGLQITAIGNSGNIFFQRFATVALLKVPIPPNVNEGDSYSVSVSFPSATSDGINAPVSLSAMPAATIYIKNVPYLVGDSASTSGAWYNAGTFGDGDLVNGDVNNAFYAASGVRVPFAFSDVYNAMDAYPPDATGFVGGDGQIRFLDWQVILLRSLRLDPLNWTRAWAPGGTLVNAPTTLVRSPLVKTQQPLTQAPWYRQVLLGAVSVGNVPEGGSVSVPVYVKLGDGSTLSGLQFRAIVTPQNGAPQLLQPPQFNLAPGISPPSIQQSSPPNSEAFGWSLGSFSFQSRSSNFLGWLTFTLPQNASEGKSYAVSFANADGAPDIHTQYEFETRSASVVVDVPAPPASICSDEWKLLFFGSLTNPGAGDLADPDNDGVANWMEYLAGTDPTDPSSKLGFTGVERRLVNGERQVVLHWLSAPGRAYEVQWSSTPQGGTWNNLGTVSGDGNMAGYPDNVGGSTARYYRLRLLP